MLHWVPFYNKSFISERFGQFQLYQDLATGLYKLCIQNYIKMLIVISDMKILLFKGTNRSILFFTKKCYCLVKNSTLFYALNSQWSKSLEDICVGFNEDWGMSYLRHGFHLAYSVFF